VQIDLFSADSSPPPAEPAPPAPSPFEGERPADLVEADHARWAELSALANWAAMRQIPSMAPHVSELGLAVVYTDRRLEAGGCSATEARTITGRRLMVPALAGGDPWAAARTILAD
jgi:hypothetical protein